MAENIMHIGTIQETMHNLGIDDIRHPLVEVVELNRLPALTGYNGQWVSYGFYCVILKTKFFAERMGMTANYFGDSIKSATGSSPQQIIQERLIGMAKDKLQSTSLSVKEIAYSLGYEYPQYFVRLFRQQTGQTPTQFRASN